VDIAVVASLDFRVTGADPDPIKQDARHNTEPFFPLDPKIQM
jgi:hypothetical protein